MEQVKVNIALDSIIEVQDALLVVKKDLIRLEGLLDHASENLLEKFLKVSNKLEQLSKQNKDSDLHNDIKDVVTELQFHDLTIQLLSHTKKILDGCVDRLGQEAVGVDEEEDGESLICESQILPEKPSPVVQDEMDAGSIELF